MRVIQVDSIYEYPKRHPGESNAWEIWGTLDRVRSAESGFLIPQTYWTHDPMVADTAEVAMRNKLPLIVEWVDGLQGQAMTACELWEERKTA